eukprot:COSAG02_NODE_7332_length_3061_cov_1.383862_2_plen_502_part_00
MEAGNGGERLLAAHAEGRTPQSDGGQEGLKQRLANMVERAREEPWRQLKGVGTCRCTPGASACILATAIVGMMGTVVTLEARTAAHRVVPAPPEPRCGVWPDYLPCAHCAYGTIGPPHRVTAADTCDSIAQAYGVPQFDLFNRNRSHSCCQNASIAVSDLIDFCKPPTVAQWRAAGHPRRRPPPGEMVSSYVGTMHEPDVQPPRGLRRLPDTINLAYLSGVEDVTSTRGEFSLGVSGHGRSGSLTDNCSAMIDPTLTWRVSTDIDGDDAGHGDHHAPHPPVSNRVWLGSMLPLAGSGAPTQQQCNWGSDISCEEWAANAAASLEKIILRYRLDGLDFNIEGASSNKQARFGECICSLFKHLQQRMGVGLVYSMTPCCGLQAMYAQVQAQCGSNVSMIQPQTRSQQPLDSGDLTTYGQNMFGWNKTMWLVDTTAGGKTGPTSSNVWKFVKQFKAAHPGAPGVFTWTAEKSKACKPSFCQEKVISMAQTTDEPEPGLLENCKC